MKAAIVSTGHHFAKNPLALLVKDMIKNCIRRGFSTHALSFTAGFRPPEWGFASKLHLVLVFRGSTEAASPEFTLERSEGSRY